MSTVSSSSPSPAAALLPRLNRRALPDASLRRVVLDRRTRQVILFLRTMEGEPLELLYHGVDLEALDAAFLEQLDRGARVVAETLEPAGDRYRHRVELDPGGVLEVVFRDAATG